MALPAPTEVYYVYFQPDKIQYYLTFDQNSVPSVGLLSLGSQSQQWKVSARLDAVQKQGRDARSEGGNTCIGGGTGAMERKDWGQQRSRTLIYTYLYVQTESGVHRVARTTENVNRRHCSNDAQNSVPDVHRAFCYCRPKWDTSCRHPNPMVYDEFCIRRWVVEVSHLL